jgi:hypothetical protein
MYCKHLIKLKSLLFIQSEALATRAIEFCDLRMPALYLDPFGRTSKISRQFAVKMCDHNPLREIDGRTFRVTSAGEEAKIAWTSIK